MQFKGQQFHPIHSQDRQEAEAEQASRVAELELQLESEQMKSEEYLDSLRRSQADFINYKRRVTQEQQEGNVAAQVAMLEQLLPMLDDLGRALQAAPTKYREQPWVQGIFLVSKRLSSTLEQMGVRQIGKEGEMFDPRLHEAVMAQPNADVPAGTILQVTRPGYALNERVIRPAQVVVAGAA